jgi:dihydrofolate reductase
VQVAIVFASRHPALTIKLVLTSKIVGVKIDPMLIVTEFISVDGVVEAPGDEDSVRGGWAFKYNRGTEGDTFKLDELMATGALLLGRRTYDGFANAWPSRTGEFADKFNSMPKYVVSSTLTEPTWSNTTVISLDDVPRLKGEVAGDIVVHGSGQLVRALTEARLVDEYRLMIYPVVVGAGARLFGETSDAISLKVAEVRPAGETVILILRPSEEPAAPSREQQLARAGIQERQ